MGFLLLMVAFNMSGKTVEPLYVFAKDWVKKNLVDVTLGESE